MTDSSTCLAARVPELALPGPDVMKGEGLFAAASETLSEIAETRRS
jgi:hypothetical protein